MGVFSAGLRLFTLLLPYHIGHSAASSFTNTSLKLLYPRNESYWGGYEMPVLFGFDNANFITNVTGYTIGFTLRGVAVGGADAIPGNSPGLSVATDSFSASNDTVLLYTKFQALPIGKYSIDFYYNVSQSCDERDVLDSNRSVTLSQQGMSVNFSIAYINAINVQQPTLRNIAGKVLRCPGLETLLEVTAEDCIAVDTQDAAPLANACDTKLRLGNDLVYSIEHALTLHRVNQSSQPITDLSVMPFMTTAVSWSTATTVSSSLGRAAGVTPAPALLAAAGAGVVGIGAAWL